MVLHPDHITAAQELRIQHLDAMQVAHTKVPMLCALHLHLRKRMLQLLGRGLALARGRAVPRGFGRSPLRALAGHGRLGQPPQRSGLLSLRKQEPACRRTAHETSGWVKLRCCEHNQGGRTCSASTAQSCLS